MIENAKWVSGGDLYRNVFQLKNTPKKAQLEVTGLGYYHAYMNGVKIGDIDLAPSYTDYNKRVEYDTFDVSSLLKVGDNVLVILTGRHHEKIKTEEQLRFQPYYKGQTMTRFSLMIDENEILSSGKTQITSSPIEDTSIYNGENFDSTKIDKDFFLNFYKTYANAVEQDFCPLLVPSTIPPIKTISRLVPTILSSTDTKIILDFGVNIAGVVEFSYDFPENTSLIFRHAEVIEDGELNFGTLRIAKATDKFVSNIGWQTYSPSFCYHGFRYAEISSNKPLDWSKAKIVAKFMRSSVKKISTFRCGNKVINNIYKIMEQTIANNLFSIPTDCHQRDERQGWMADAHLSAESAIYHYDMESFYSKYLLDIVDTIDANGDLTVFTAPVAFGGESLAWQGAYFIIVDNLVSYYNNEKVLSFHYPYLKKYFSNLSKRYTHLGLNMSGFGDWLGVSHTKEEHIRDAFFYLFATTMQKFATILHFVDDEHDFAKFASEIKKDYYNNYYSPHESTNKNSGYYGACADLSQLSNALPLCFGLPLSQDYERIKAKFIHELTVARGETMLTTGLIGTKYIFDCLEKINRNDIALELILRKNYPSWRFMLSKNATTTWERWEYMTDNDMNSHCHTPLASPSKWIFTHCSGINYPIKTDSGFSFNFTPLLDKRIGNVKASLCGKFGKITIKINYKTKKIILSAPNNLIINYDNTFLNNKNFSITILTH